MFNALGSLATGFNSGVEGYRDSNTHMLNEMGLQALGKALAQQQPMQQQPMQQGPIDQMPMAPPPGQPSMPRSSQPDLAQGGQPPGAAVMDGGSGAPAMGGPPPGAQQASAGMGGGIDLRSMISRIKMANPNLPPQAMVAALTASIPLLNAQSRMDLVDLRRQMYGLSGSMRGRAMDLRERELGVREKGLGIREKGMELPPEAVKALTEGHITTFTNGTKWTLEGGKPKQITDSGLGDDMGMGGFNPQRPQDDALFAGQ